MFRPALVSEPPVDQYGVQPLLASGDGVITLLARSDPASADRLADLYTAYRKIMSG